MQSDKPKIFFLTGIQDFLTRRQEDMMLGCEKNKNMSSCLHVKKHVFLSKKTCLHVFHANVCTIELYVYIPF